MPYLLMLSACGSVFLEEVNVDGGADAERADVRTAADVEADSPVDARDGFTLDVAEDVAPDADGGGAGECTGGLRIASDWNAGEALSVDFNPGEEAVGYAVDPVRQTLGGDFMVAIQTTFDGDSQLTLIAVSESGTRVGSFGDAGRADLGISGTVHSLESARDGGWLVSASDSSGPVIVKTDADGNLDNAFGDSGSVRPLPPLATFAAPNTLDRFDGGYLIGGQVAAGAFSFWAALMEEDGSLRSAFGAEGHSIDTLDGGDEFGLAEISADTGFYYNSGSTFVSGRDFDCALTRRNVDGAIDGAFGVDGWAVFDLDGENTQCPFLVETPTWIYAGGLIGREPTQFAAIFRFARIGDVDSSFADDGVLILDATREGIVRDLEALPDGTLVAVGRFGREESVAFVQLLQEDGRLLASATLDLSSGRDEFQSALIHGERILAFGVTEEGAGNAFVLADYELCD